jgi:hypothetical protein
LLDKRLGVRRIEVDKVKSTSCHLHFHFANNGLTLEIRLKKQGDTIQVTFWDTKGKVRVHFKQTLQADTLEAAQKEVERVLGPIFGNTNKKAKRHRSSAATEAGEPRLDAVDTLV